MANLGGEPLTGHLTLTIVQAKNLHDIELLGTMSPYVHVEYGSERFQTDHKKGGGKNPPPYNFEMIFNVNNAAWTDLVHVDVKDHETLKDGSIGRASVELGDFVRAARSGAGPRWYVVRDRSDFEKVRGEVEIVARFDGSGGEPDNMAGAGASGCGHHGHHHH